MNQSNIDFLEANRGHWDTLRIAGYMRNLDGATRNNMQRIMGEEFAPGFRTDLWCTPCVTEMVRLLYTHFDKWKEENEVKNIKAVFPKHHRR